MNDDLARTGRPRDARPAPRPRCAGPGFTAFTALALVASGCATLLGFEEFEGQGPAGQGGEAGLEPGGTAGRAGTSAAGGGGNSAGGGALTGGAAGNGTASGAGGGDPNLEGSCPPPQELLGTTFLRFAHLAPPPGEVARTFRFCYRPASLVEAPWEGPFPQPSPLGFLDAAGHTALNAGSYDVLATAGDVCDPAGATALVAPHCALGNEAHVTFAVVGDGAGAPRLVGLHEPPADLVSHKTTIAHAGGAAAFVTFDFEPLGFDPIYLPPFEHRRVNVFAHDFDGVGLYVDEQRYVPDESTTTLDEFFLVSNSGASLFVLSPAPAVGHAGALFACRNGASAGCATWNLLAAPAPRAPRSFRSAGGR